MGTGGGNPFGKFPAKIESVGASEPETPGGAVKAIVVLSAEPKYVAYLLAWVSKYVVADIDPPVPPAGSSGGAGADVEK